MVEPHGGVLINRFLVEDISMETQAKDQGLPQISLDPRQLSDAYLIAQGALSPLDGYMGSVDYQSVLNRLRLANDLVWSLPITLAVSRSIGQSLKKGQDAALTGPDGNTAGIIHVEEVYSYDKQLEAELVYGTIDETHPGVNALHQQGELLVAGKIDMFAPQEKDRPFAKYYLTPSETRTLFEQRGWHSVVGFQTRNPIHRAHEYIQKCALEIFDGLLIHPLVGETKQGDIPADVRMACYEVLLEEYYPSNRVVLSVLPAFMRYAGPREAVFHAIVRKNYGCTHFIVGRDHAGVGNFYEPYDAHRIFDRFSAEELGIVPLFFEDAFYCRRCQTTATSKTCPHSQQERISVSGTELRKMLDSGRMPADEITRPEVAKILAKMAPSNKL